MKIIFLDIDGVLVTQRFFEALDELCKMNDWDFSEKCRDNFGHLFDPLCVEQLDRIIKETEAKIVISSTWRFPGGLNDMKRMWEKRGLPGEIIDVTPDSRPAEMIFETPMGKRREEESVPRGMEIDAWLDKQGYFRGASVSNITSYVIIDDDIDMLYIQRDNIVTTSFRQGLTKDLADECIDILLNRRVNKSRI
jgi:hypothetical protein